MTLMLKRGVLLKRSVLLKRGRNRPAPGVWLRVRTLATKVAGTRLAPSCIPATPIKLSLEEVASPTLAR